MLRSSGFSIRRFQILFVRELALLVYFGSTMAFRHLSAGSNKEPISDHYNIGLTLGSGTFSVVKKAEHRKTKQVYAIKCIDKGAVEDNEEMIGVEIDILKQVSHKNIIGLKEMFEDQKFIYLVMELVTGGELFETIVERGSYSEKDASVVITQLLQAVQYLHGKGIVHRDLKPENLLYEDATATTIKIADFGLSKIISSRMLLTTACGTPGYVAPEVLLCDGYEKPVDLWSVDEQIMQGSYEYMDEYWDSISPSAKDLIDHLLVVDPKKRYTAAQALNHPWIAGNAATRQDIDSVVQRLRQWNAKRRLKSAMLATLAVQKFVGLWST
ncbi:calcium/calmodulin-dependent protein kinase I [Planoprotostelium fungivorum]|uniref:non-specific serine/threonine protein kinase n=1 Tax=Planoprotostelium fungivorum TaxID=1890364 RepID=A0A2P6N507_9EUKA|nr:calcium/calmodulin-dependent protein kinase I [Planoprotostelium fungivorum]